MLILSANNQSIEVVLAGSSVAPLPVVVSYKSVLTGSADAVAQLSTTNGTTAVTVLAAPAAGDRNMVELLSVYNPNTDPAVLTVRIDQGGTKFVLAKVTLALDERLEFTEFAGFRVMTSVGSVKTSINQGASPVTAGYNRVSLASDVTNDSATANTIQDVTGLSFPVAAAVRTAFRFVIDYTAAATTTGSRWTINGPGLDRLSYRSRYGLTRISETVNNGLDAYDLPAASNVASAATGANLAVVEGIIVPAVDGTVIARFASEIASSAIVAKAGSYVDYWNA